MKKIILILIFSLFVARPSFAQNNMEGMKFLTINALMQYGQKLYDRGDYNEASAVFDHVLTYDSRQRQALQFLKEMGRSPAPDPALILKTSDLPAVKTIDIFDTESLKGAIKAEKQTIEKLQTQIVKMRGDLASRSN